MVYHLLVGISHEQCYSTAFRFVFLESVSLHLKLSSELYRVLIGEGTWVLDRRRADDAAARTC